jgi:site-specific DNA-cytosine methylase
MTRQAMEIRHFHLFAGLGGGARGFNKGEARVGNLQGKFRCIGGIDNDAAAMRDFARLAGVRGTVLDMFDREQFTAFHGHAPAADWREATPQDIQRAAGGERPHIVFLSAPCKGFSGLLSETKSKTAKYQALNRLTLRGVWLMCEAWADDPPELVLFENVPRLATRGRVLLDQITALLRGYGYATAETTHDCGELGNLAQSRKRFLLVARHIAKVPPLLYEPERRPLRAVGDVLGRMLMPGDLRAGPMHRIPSLSWKTWVRLAFVEAGKDWRSLNRLAVEDGVLRDYLMVPEMNDGIPVADMRAAAAAAQYQQYGVRRWDEATGAVTGQSACGGGAHSIADPRMPPSDTRHYNMFRVIRWAKASCCVTGSQQVGSGAACVADPRTGMAVDRPAYLNGGHFGVLPWDSTSGAVPSSACHDNGRWSVADPRMPTPDQKLIALITSEDGTWHRPFTTFELAALQSLVDPEEQLELDGLSDQAWRERIGNAVPSDAAQAIASEMGRTLLLAWSGETFQLSAAPVWVRQVAVAVSVAGGVA